jgi:hypothetical protein
LEDLKNYPTVQTIYKKVSFSIIYYNAIELASHYPFSFKLKHFRIF